MQILIIGNGISGVTAARHIRKYSDHEVTIVSSESAHFYSRPSLMYIYMGHMRYEDTKPYEDFFWEKNRIQLVQALVNRIDFAAKSAILSNGNTLTYDKLILAVGSKSNKFGWPGQDLNGVRGLYSLQDVEEMEKYSPGLQRAVIVGGGLIGIEMAEMFHSRNISVTMLVREKSYWDNILPYEESQMVTRHIQEHHIDLRLQTELKEIHDDGNGICCGVTTNTGERIDCGFVGLTPGVSANIQFLRESGLDINRGILVDGYLKTSADDVYAIGDCVELRTPSEGRRSIEAVWYTGKIMGEAVAKTICSEPTIYDPGIWYNSAKFLDIEYQVYGNVSSKLAETQDTIYWEHKDGKRSIRLVYDAERLEIQGFNLMGIRYRHEVCEKWIAERTLLQDVVQQLKLANFDPEFFPLYEEHIVQMCNSKHDLNIRSSASRNWNQVFDFLKA